MMGGYVIDPQRCAYGAADSLGVALKLSFVTLFNNDALGRVFAIHDIGRGINTQAIAFLTIQKGSLGSSPLNCSPVVADNPQPPGQILTGAGASELPELNNGVGNSAPTWFHEFPIAIIPAGYRITAYGGTVNMGFSCGFWFQVLDRSQLAPLDQPLQLAIPKVLKLTVETE
jgi:hypothetical protein